MTWANIQNDLRRALDDGDAAVVLSRLSEAFATGMPAGRQFSFVAKAIRALGDEAPMGPVCRIAVLGDTTIAPYVDAVHVALASERQQAVVSEGGYGLFRQDILDPDSALYRSNPDGILIAVGLESVGEYPAAGESEEQVHARLERIVAQWRGLWETLNDRWDGYICQHLFPSPEPSGLGVAEGRVPWSPRRFIAALNERLIEEAPSNLRWVDIGAMAARVGTLNWFDPRLYFHGKFAINPNFLDVYAYGLAAAWRSAVGRTYKALVVDLDNTLWGGVVGDDGLDGIDLGPGSPTGEAHENFCRYLSALKARGVILAVCSKNDPEIAHKVFTDHAHMPLGLSDFATVVCNWEDKAANLRAIAKNINVSLSSLVFVDDNPAEVALVRAEIPQVRTLLFDGDPAHFVRTLDAHHLFDAPFISHDDLGRTASYAARNAIAEAQDTETNLEGFLTGLQMTGLLREATQPDLARLAQMELKTNQFNLTTPRYTQEQLSGFLADRDYRVLAFELEDKLAKHGLVSSLVVRRLGAVLKIDSWLMSCRVFGRTAENFIARELVGLAQKMDCRELEGTFVESDRNMPVADLYERLGFSLQHDGGWRRSTTLDDMPETLIVRRDSAQQSQ